MKVAQSRLTLCDPMDCRLALSVEFSRQEYWSGMPFPSPGDFPNPRIELRSPALQADSLPSEPPGKPMSTGVGSLFLAPGDLPNPRIELRSPALQTEALTSEPPGK